MYQSNNWSLRISVFCAIISFILSIILWSECRVYDIKPDITANQQTNANKQVESNYRMFCQLNYSITRQNPSGEYAWIHYLAFVLLGSVVSFAIFQIILENTVHGIWIRDDKFLWSNLYKCVLVFPFQWQYWWKPTEIMQNFLVYILVFHIFYFFIVRPLQRSWYLRYRVSSL